MGTEYYVKYNNIFVMIPKIQKKKKKNVVTQVWANSYLRNQFGIHLAQSVSATHY